jgi:hypothetical protein
MRTQTTLGSICVIFALCAIPGCEPSYPETAPVSGKVTLGGEPVSGGEIQFFPDEGIMATGRIESDGTYRLTTFQPDDGAVIGEHRVAVRAEGPISATGLITVPKRYQNPETSNLTATVKPGSNRINFPLSTTVDPTATADVP